jgi:putative transposase
MNPLAEWLFASPQERHRPPHATDRGIALFITGSTVDRIPHLATAERRDEFAALLSEVSREFDVELVAWVVLREHYHVVIVPHAPDGFSPWITALHSRTAKRWNEEDGAPGRQCWYDYWDRSLWTEGDLLSRISYVHRNPLKHGYVQDPEEWRWSSLRSYLAWPDWENARSRLERFPAPRKLPGDEF